ncbi:MAG: methyltransferase family protein [Myxococcota bacterium]
MPQLALALVIVWFLVLFAFRTALQWWKTGSGGVRGFSGPVGSMEWNAGLITSLGMAAGMLAPVAALLGWPGGRPWFAHDPTHLAGAGVVALGIVGALAAQVRMGDSWRIGVDASERTALVTGGLFAWVRNPIFSFLMVTAVGLLALLPNPFALASGLLTFAGIELQVRRVEEPYLRATHGEDYERYAERVGRFLPGVGRGVGRPA